MKNIFNKLKTGLARTHRSLTNKIEDIFSSGASYQEIMDSLEESLITADVGVNVSMRMTNWLKENARTRDIEELKCFLRDSVRDILKRCQSPLDISKKPCIIAISQKIIIEEYYLLVF